MGLGCRKAERSLSEAYETPSCTTGTTRTVTATIPAVLDTSGTVSLCCERLKVTVVRTERASVTGTVVLEGSIYGAAGTLLFRRLTAQNGGSRRR